jgi:hypothetical protein
MQIRKISLPFKGEKTNIDKVLRDVYKAFRGNISYGGMTQSGLKTDNIDGAYGVISNSGLANIEFAVVHNLNRIPVGFHVINQSLAGSFYGTPTLGTAWTKTNIYIKCNTANVAATLFIF